MNCREFMEELVETRTPVWSIRRRLAARAHERGCDTCRARARDYRAAMSAVKRRGRAVCPDHVIRSVIQRTGTGRRMGILPVFQPLLRHPMVTAATAAVLLVCSLWILTVQSPTVSGYKQTDVVQADRQVKQTLAYLDGLAARTHIKLSVSKLLGMVQDPMAVSMNTGLKRSVSVPFNAINHLFMEGDRE